MAAYHQVYGSRHLQADCQEPGLAPEPYARQSSMGYLYLLVYAVEVVGESCACIYTDCRLYWEWMTFMRPLMSTFSTSLLLWLCCCSIVLTVNVCEPLVRSSLYQRVTERASEWLLNKQWTYSEIIWTLAAVCLWCCLQCFDAVGWAAGRASGL